MQRISTPTIRKRTWNTATGTTTKYQLDYSVWPTPGDHRRIRKSFATKAAANEHYTKTAHLISSDAWLPESEQKTPSTGAPCGCPSDGGCPPGGIPSLTQLITEHLHHKTHQIRASSHRTETFALNAFCAYTGGTTPITKITNRKITEYLSYRKTLNRPPATISNDLTYIRGLFNTAVAWNLLDGNPATGIKKPRKIEQSVVYWELTELNAILNNAKTHQTTHNNRNGAPYLHTLITTLLYTGLRISEALNLRWTNLDLETNRLYLENTATYQTKSGKARRIDLHPQAHQALTQWKRWWHTEMARSMQRAADTALSPRDRRHSEQRHALLTLTQPSPEQYIFPHLTTGEKLTTIKTSWKRLLRDTFGETENYTTPTGQHRTRTILPEKYNRGIHSLRHTCAVQLAKTGTSITHIQKLLGHADITTTQKYLRFYPDEGAAAPLTLPNFSAPQQSPQEIAKES